MNQGLRAGFLGFDFSTKKAMIWDGGHTPFSASNQGDVGAAVVSLLKHPAETANKYLYVSTITTSQAEILKSIQSHTGSRWTVEDVDTQSQIARGRQMVSEGDFAGMFLLVQASMYGTVEGIRSNYALEEELANRVLGLPAEGSLDAVIKETVASSV